METQVASTARAEGKMNEVFRTIRNRLRRYRPSGIVDTCINVLRLPQIPERMREYPPWFVLRLLEWTFLHGDHTAASYPAFSDRDFNALVRLMMGMNDAGDPAIARATAPQLMKNLAHEQFPWRDARPAPEVMARNTVLFLELSKATRITERFMDLTGIPLDAFLGLSWLLWCHFFPHNQRPPDFVAAWHFRNLVPEAQRWAVPLLEHLSLTEQQVGAYLKSLPQGPDTWDYRLHREPPLKRKPLLRRDNRYFPYSTVLLARALEHFVYEVLREDDPGELMKPFRAAFEEYVGIGLDGIGLPYLREADLRVHLPDNRRV